MAECAGMNRDDYPSLTDREWRAACLNNLEDNSVELLKSAAYLSTKFAEIEHDLRHGDPVLQIIVDAEAEVQAALCALELASNSLDALAVEGERAKW